MEAICDHQLWLWVFSNHLKFQYIWITHVPSRYHRDTKMNRTESHRENFQKNHCKCYFCGIYTYTFLFDTCLWHTPDSIPLTGWSRENRMVFYKFFSPLKKIKRHYRSIYHYYTYSVLLKNILSLFPFSSLSFIPIYLYLYFPYMSATFQIIGIPLFLKTVLPWFVSIALPYPGVCFIHPFLFLLLFPLCLHKS